MKKIYTIATAHLDTCWLWTYEKTISSFVPGTLKENFKLFKKFPDYKFNFEGSNRYELMEEYYPEDFEKLKAYVRSGNWNPCGSCYENGDVNTPSPEALTRNIIYGNGYFREKFGVESNDIFLPDCFGFGRALPSIAAHSGLTGFSTQKLTWGGAVDVPFDIGRWQGKDGKGIWCALKPGNYVSISGNPRENEKALANLKNNIEKYDFAKTFVYHGNGDRGGGPAKASVKNIAKAVKDNAKEDIKVLFASTKEFFDNLENMSAEEKSRMPVYNGELLLTEHGTGSYTSRTVTKRWNRRCELLADAAERFSAAAYAEGIADYPAYTFEKAWKRVILHQFHDDITGTSFEDCYKRSHNDYVQSMHAFSAEYAASLKALTARIDTSFVKGIAVAVSNPVQAVDSRLGSVSADIDYDGDKAYSRVYDNKGNEVPSQMRKLSEGKVRVSFMATVPSNGIKVYDVQFSDEKSPVETSLSIDGSVLENDYIKVTLDSNGDIASVYDKLRQKEALRGSLKLAIHHDVDSYAWPSWEVKQSDFSRPPYMYPSSPVITTEENGPALCSLKVVRKAGKSTFTQVISLGAESRYVSVQNEVDWREEASLLKAVFNTTSRNEKALYDIGFGYTERGTNTPRLFEVPAQRWAGITDSKGDFGTAIFSDSRTGWDKPDASTLRLTCIHTPLNNYRWECSQHIMDLGINRFGFAVCPHGGETEKIIADADAFCQPMHTFITDNHKGSLDEYTAVKVSSDKVRMTAMKKAEGSDKIIVRVCEYTGEAQKNVALTFPMEIGEITEVRGDEKEIGSIPVTEGKLIFDIDANAVRSFAITFKDTPAFESTQASLALPYNAVAVTDNSSKSTSTLKGGISVPKEILPEKLLSSGISYTMPKDTKSGLICKGQTIALPEGYKAVSFLATSLGGDRKVAFRVGTNEVSADIQDSSEAIGIWDLMRNRITGYIKPQPQAVTFTHTHSKNGDIIAKQMYFYNVIIPTADSREITLPDDENILILSATMLKDNMLFQKADEHFDTMKKRAFDYTFSPYALRASRPAVYEIILDKFLDRTYSPKIRTAHEYTKFSLGEVYSYLRNIYNLKAYPSRKNKMLKR